MIVAVLGEKGGTGKTTLAVHLAGWRVDAGREVMLIDADRQGSASLWAESRHGQQLATPTSVQKFDSGLLRAIRDLARRYDDIVVDIGSGEGASIESVLRVADIAIVPVQPNGLDIWTMGLLDELTAAALENNDGLKVWAVLNRASPHHAGRDVQDALAALQACRDIEVSDLVIRERSSTRRVVPAGLLVNEYRPRDLKATEEFSDLYRLVFAEDSPSHETNDGELADNEYEHQAK